MKTSKTMIAVAIAALIPLGAAVAGDMNKSGKESSSFDKLDTNLDGRVSESEAAVDATIVFSSTDANSDGYLDKSEWHSREQGANSHAPKSTPETSADPALPQASEPAPADTETPPQ